MPAGPVAANRAERRQITVLFYDMVGSTELSASLDPEDFREAISHFHAVASEAVRQYDAFIGAHVGDGGIIYFGYPVAREDAAECAILSGLALIEAIGRITLPNGRPARARVGIATGTSIVGRIEDGDTGNSAVGQVTSLAARLQSRAEPNQCVIAQRTRRLVGELFQLQDLGLIEAKGFASDVHAFAVLGSSATDRFKALRHDDAGLIGREAQTEQLRQKWNAALQGQGETCLIIGESGVGKSRLAVDFAKSLGPDAAIVLSCYCTPHSRQAALRPFVAYFRKIAGARDHQTELSLATFDQQLAPNTSELDRYMLGQLVGFDCAAPRGVDEMTANQLRVATIDALIQQVRLLAAHRPVLVLIEDMHWADPSSCELLEKVVEGGNLGRAMVLMTARPEVRETWELASAIDAIELPPFSAAESHMLINRILGGKASAGMVGAITERAGGVALFIEELTKSIRDSAAHVPGGAADLLELQSDFLMPETLQDSLLARLDQLGEAKRIAQIAAVVGRDFNARDVTMIAPELADQIAAGIATLREAGLVVPLSKADDELQFRHVLIQEIAYSTLVRGERRQYNARLLDALEARAQAGHVVDAERWAHYAWEAGRPARAIHYWLLAGQEALRVFATREAEARLRRGLGLIDTVTDQRARAELELDLLLTLGKVLLAKVGHANPETGEVFDRAKLLSEEIGHSGKLLAAMHGQQAYDLQLSRMRAARNRGNDMLALADRFDDDAWRVIGYRSRGIASFPLGDYEQGAADLLSGIGLLRKIGPTFAREIVADDLLVAMQIYASWSLIFLGQTERGQSFCHAAFDRAELIRQPYTRAFSHVGRNYCQLLLRDFDGLEAGLNECITLCEDNDIFYFLLTEKVHLAHYHALQGERGAAARIHAAIEGYRQTGSILYQPTYKHWEALAWLAEGDDAQARVANRWAIETAEGYGMHHMLGEYYGLKAVLDHRERKHEEALRAADEARRWVDTKHAVLAGQRNSELWASHGVAIQVLT